MHFEKTTPTKVSFTVTNNTLNVSTRLGIAHSNVSFSHIGVNSLEKSKFHNDT